VENGRMVLAALGCPSRLRDVWTQAIPEISNPDIYSLFRHST